MSQPFMSKRWAGREARSFRGGSPAVPSAAAEAGVPGSRAPARRGPGHERGTCRCTHSPSPASSPRPGAERGRKGRNGRHRLPSGPGPRPDPAQQNRCTARLPPGRYNLASSRVRGVPTSPTKTYLPCRTNPFAQNPLRGGHCRAPEPRSGTCCGSGAGAAAGKDASRRRRPASRRAPSQRRLRGGRATAASLLGRESGRRRRARSAEARRRPRRPGIRATPRPSVGLARVPLTGSAHEEGPATGRSGQRRPGLVSLTV